MQGNRRRHCITRLLVLLALAGSLSHADEQSIRPGINRHYENPDWSVWVTRFERPDREVYVKRDAIVAACGLRPGMAVADIGAGTGLFTRLFAPLVSPGGKVYAVDISPTFIENILRTSQEQGLANVEGIVNNQHGLPLPPATIDLAFLSNTYHHFEYPQTMLALIHRALRRDGRLIVIDFRKQPGITTGWVMEHVRANRDTVIQEIRAAGFRLLEDKPLLQTSYFLAFARQAHETLPTAPEDQRMPQAADPGQAGLRE